MYSGAQLSLYPMSDDYVGIILGSLHALDPYRSQCRIETDDLSTLVVGPPDRLFPAMRDLLLSAAATERHCVLSAAVSRGCPGEPDDPICAPRTGARPEPLEARVAGALRAVANAERTGRAVAAQFSLYPLGPDDYMAEIYGCIEFLKDSGVFGIAKNFCTKLRGDAGPVFAALSESFLSFGPPDGHVALDLIVSANSPTG
jgi:energy-coupling factor transport system substrate-specific component